MPGAFTSCGTGTPAASRSCSGRRPEEEEAKDRAKAHAAPGAIRRVWGNPVLWREIRTRAYGRRPLVVKLAYFVVVGLIAYAALTPLSPASGGLRGRLRNGAGRRC